MIRLPTLVPTVIAVSFLAAGPGCGGGEGDDVIVDELPTAPQIIPNTGFITFTDVARATETLEVDVTFLNGGHDDLVIDTIEIVDDAAGVFDIVSIIPSDSTAASRDAVEAADKAALFYRQAAFDHVVDALAAEIGVGRHRVARCAQEAVDRLARVAAGQIP